MMQGDRYVSLLAELGDAFHPATDPEERYFVILRYYVDVSGKETTRDERAVTAAGYVASQARWQQFEQLWDATLKLGAFPYFHATEFFACAGPFERLRADPVEHKNLASLFALAAHTAIPYGFSSSLDLDHFDPVFRAACRKLRTPHDRIPAAMIAVAEVCEQVAQLALRPGSGLQAQLFIEDGDGVGEILEWLKHLKRVGEGWTGAFVGFNSLSGDEYPLQAADYLAHETWLETKALMRDHSRTWDDTRDTFKLLCTGASMVPPELGTSKVDARYATEDNFQRAAPRLVAFIAAHPEYQRRSWTKRWRRNSRQWIRAQWREARYFARGRVKRAWYGRLGMRWP